MEEYVAKEPELNYAVVTIRCLADGEVTVDGEPAPTPRATAGSYRAILCAAPKDAEEDRLSERWLSSLVGIDGSVFKCTIIAVTPVSHLERGNG